MNRRLYDKQYKDWIKKIFARDRFKCQWPDCNKAKGRLNAHHIKKWADYPGLRFHLDNGITLCKYHHDLIKSNEENYEMMFFKIIAGKK